MHDGRVPVAFGLLAEATPGDAVLFEGEARDLPGVSAFFQPAAGHAPGCTCCATRSDAGRALGWLLHARARNEMPFFQRVLAVVATEQGRMEIAAALRNDPIASTCFKPAGTEAG